MERKIIRGLIGLMLIIGLWFRISGTADGFFAFAYDQGKDFLALHKIVNLHKITLIGPSTGIDGVFHGVWWYYFLVPWFFIWQGNPQAVLLIFSCFCTFTTIVLSFVLGREISGNRLGLIMSGLVTVSLFFIRTSVQLWHPFMLPVLILSFLILLWRFLFKKGKFLWVGLILGLIFEFEFATGGLFLLAISITFVVCRIKINLSQALYGLGGFGIWLVPRIVFELRNGFIQTNSFIRYVTNYQTKVGHIPLIERFAGRANSYFNIFCEAFTRENKYLGGILLIMILAGVMIWRKKTDHKIRSFMGIISVFMLVLYIITSVYPDTLWNYYLISLPPLYLIFTSWFLYQLVKYYSYAGWLLYGAVFIYNLSPWTLINAKKWEGDYSVFKNEIAVVDAIYKQAKKDDFNVQTYSPAVIDYDYQYLFIWYGQKTYGYVPDRERVVKTVFYIIEPNPDHPTLPRMWLREREGDGRIDWQGEFPGGVKVEKRVR